MIINFLKNIFVISISAIFIFHSGCSKDSKTTTQAGVQTTTDPNVSYTQVLPGNLAVSSNTEKISTSTVLSVRASHPPVGRDYQSKVAAIAAVLSIDASGNIADCAGAINLTPVSSPQPDCYGPDLYYSNNHPDNATGPGACADFQTITDSTVGADCSFPSGDAGLWLPTFDGGEACAAAKLNNIVGQASEKIDLAMGVEAMLICAAKVSGKGVPAKGSEITLTSEATQAVSEGLTITLAKISREANDTSTGLSVYVSDITGTISSQGGVPAKDFTLRFKHIPENADNSIYTGLLTIITDPNSNDPNMSSMKDVISVLYGSSSSSLNYRMRLATFCSSTDTTIYFGTNGEVTELANNVGSQSDCAGASKNGWVGGFNESIAEIDTTNGIGKLAFGWQAGQGDGFLRTFNVETKSDGTGTAYFGFTKNALTPEHTSGRTDGDLAIDGMICNWSGPNFDHDPSNNSLVQMQTLTKDSSGVWIPNQNKISFAPTNSCSVTTGSDGSDFKFGDDITEYTSKTSPFTHNLASMTVDYNFLVPQVPSLPN